MHGMVTATPMFDNVVIYPIGVSSAGQVAMAIELRMGKTVIRTLHDYPILGQYGTEIDLENGTVDTVFGSPRDEWSNTRRYGTAFCGEMVDSLRLEPARLRKGGKR